jgi:hypothetical protein
MFYRAKMAIHASYLAAFQIFYASQHKGALSIKMANLPARRSRPREWKILLARQVSLDAPTSRHAVARI